MLQGSNEAILSTSIKPPFSIKTFVLSILSDRLRQVLLYFKQVVKILYMYLILILRYTNNVSKDVSCGFILVYTSRELFLNLFLCEARLLLYFGTFRELYL